MPVRKKTTAPNTKTALLKKKVAKKRASPNKAASKKTSSRAKPAHPATTHSLTLESVADINKAKSLHKQLNQINNDSDVNIDASAIEMIDTAVLQLLYAFVIKVRSSNHKVNWIKPSREFIRRANLLGLSQPIGLC